MRAHRSRSRSRPRRGRIAALALAAALAGSSDRLPGRGLPGPAAAAALAGPRFTREQMEATLGERERWLFVCGTRDPAQAGALRERATRIARRLFGGDTTAVVADRAAREPDLAGRPVLLLGGPEQNEWTRKLAASLPVQFGRASCRERV